MIHFMCGALRVSAIFYTENMLNGVGTYISILTRMYFLGENLLNTQVVSEDIMILKTFFLHF